MSSFARLSSALGLRALVALAPLAPLAIGAACSSTPETPESPTPTTPPIAPQKTAEQAGKTEAPDTKAPPAKASLVSNELHDDVEGAMKKARAEGKVVLVDAWAPWCHTCLSMKSYVMPDPSLAPLAERVVVVSIDTDRPENAGFLEKYVINVWPSFFVIDPASEQVVGYWPGSASAREMKQLLEEGVAAVDDARAAKMPEGSPDRELLKAKAAHASGQFDKAAKAYARAVEKAPPSWTRKSEALMGWVFALYRDRNWSECARVGKTHAGEVTGAAVPADYSSLLLTCASKLPAGEAQAEARRAAVAKLRAITENPPAEASADDRADALAIFADALREEGDVRGAIKANEARVAIMEAASKAAPTPEAAATYDYALAAAYVAMGRANDAVKMLEQREREMPDSYEPPGRLAGVLTRIGRLPEALQAVDRAIKRAYGPRKLQYLKLKADILEQMGDVKGQVEALRDEVAGYKALAKGHASKERLADAQKRLEAAEKKAPKAANK